MAREKMKSVPVEPGRIQFKAVSMAANDLDKAKRNGNQDIEVIFETNYADITSTDIRSSKNSKEVMVIQAYDGGRRNRRDIDDHIL